MRYIVYPEIFGKDVKAFFTGKSPGADPRRIAEISGINKDNIYFPRQEHTSRVIRLRGDLKEDVADAVITERKDILLGVQVADCVPILLYNRDSNIIGAVHAGWRGTSKGIIKEAIKKMLLRKPDDVIIAIGPAIRQCCYQVGDDVLEAVARQTGKGDYYRHGNGAAYLDLPAANRHQAMSTGIPSRNIWISDECTYCRPERFYSYRYSKGPTGRQAGFIGML